MHNKIINFNDIKVFDMQQILNYFYIISMQVLCILYLLSKNIINNICILIKNLAVFDYNIFNKNYSCKLISINNNNNLLLYNLIILLSIIKIYKIKMHINDSANAFLYSFFILS